jgi:hypothetical protein
MRNLQNVRTPAWREPWERSALEDRLRCRTAAGVQRVREKMKGDSGRKRYGIHTEMVPMWGKPRHSLAQLLAQRSLNV